ncbi:hypothetical protein [Cellulomonas marina]|uniref:Uncharacterized protein n=1 Tax=Cellulomonas marina TaxID=988821 RepID=A0A1I0WNR4_9CELL|nr:hypothetical protein [Cellulomonas marina]GIG27771.1 hypothetical protein Cma02nite_03710 [Cellulomonas marina]SFA90251.1 hypothetical protein SAMN05421867_103120 [Cellulomonas marina]
MDRDRGHDEGAHDGGLHDGGLHDEGRHDEGLQDEGALDRLRAGDPARGVPVPEARIRADVSRRTGVPLAGAVGAELEGDTLDGAGDGVVGGAREPGAQVVPLAPRRRRRTAWTAAAAVAGALVVGGGGYGIGVAASGGDAEASTVTALPALSLSGGAGGASAAVGTQAEAATPRVAGDTAAGASSIGLWGGGRTVFTGTGLGDERSSARAWALDASAVIDAGTAQRVAAALGVTGEPVAQWGSWVVGSTDGGGPSVMLGTGGQVSYWTPTTTVCEPVGAVVEPQPAPLDDAGSGAGSSDAGSSEAGSSGAVEGPAGGAGGPGACTVPPTQDAVDRLTQVARDLGTDLSGWAVGTTSDGVGVSATASRVVDGRAAGDAWTAYVTAEGLVSFSANLASLVDLGTYDVVSAQEAVDRLNDPRFGASGGVVALADAAGTTGAEPFRAEGDAATSDLALPAPDPGATPTAVPVPTAGEPLPWPVTTVTLVSAELTVATAWTPDGSSLLVPTWALTAEDGTVWTVVAVVDEGLDLTAP